MPYYQDAQGNLHCLDDAQFSYLLPAGCTAITDDQAQTIMQQQAAAAAAAVPQQVTAVQLRLALTAQGLRSDVETAISAASKDTQDYWDYSPYFVRTHPLLIGIATQLNKTSTDIDALFVAAGQL